MIKLNGVEVGSKFFPNGELNLLDIHEAIDNQKLHSIVMKYYNDKDLMALYFVKKYLDDIDAGKPVNLIVSYMPYSRMDRAETSSTPFMLDYVSDFINDLNFTKVDVHEPHSQVTVDLLNDVTPHYTNEFIVEAVAGLEKFNPERDFIVFPDKGAMIRYDGRIVAENMIYGEKKRNFETGAIENLELHVIGDVDSFEGATAIIIDDLSSYGTTFVKTSEKLRELGFERVVLLVFHAENSIFKGKLFEHIDHIYTTNSILTEQNNWENKKFQNQLTLFEF